ncbi:MAG: hypothetical protein EXR11_06375 [Rhodospirillaceae bacterium]|nr:hypothetical protein [Rhodospirillaceae bacterium]
MTSIDFFHFAHVFAFALIVGVDMPAFYAAKRASVFGTLPTVRILAARTASWCNAISSAALALLLPLGVVIGIDLGVYTLTDPGYLTATWIIGLGWFALVVATGVLKQRGLGEILYTIEIWVRAIIGLGTIYDGIVGFMGTGMVQANWLALKVLLLGLMLVVSALVRSRLRPVRAALAGLDPMSALNATWDDKTAQTMTDSLNRLRPLAHSILFMALIAAWMGINKSW